MTKILPSRGRKKIARCTTFNTDNLICTCRGPTSLSSDQLERRPKIYLTQEELQTLVDRDNDKKTMLEGAQCMGVSKTVYAGICTSARQKITQSIITGSILMIACQKDSV